MNHSTSLTLPHHGIPAPPPSPTPRKLNATKHGIFSRAILLHSESPAEYNSLLAKLRRSFRPRTGVERLLVEKLATLLWRHRRLLLAERAEIDKAVDSLDAPQDQQPSDEDFRLARQDDIHGLMWRVQEPDALPTCLALLLELRDAVAGAGFALKRDSGILRDLYGLQWENKTLAASYKAWQAAAQAGEDERRQKGHPSPDECVKNFLREIDPEIRTLKRAQKAQLAREFGRRNLDILRSNVPDAPGLDRLLRYEATLERAFERTLSQLERLQRLRAGLPVSPEIKLQLTR